MARKKWEFRDKNEVRDAVDYLHRKLKNDPLYLEHLQPIDEKHAKRAFFEKKLHADTLRAWIDDWLLPSQIKRLRTYLRVKRSREAKATKNITIDADVYEKLADYAKSYGVTLSEAIARLLAEEEKKIKAGRLF